jgi:hypothetical protein
MTNLLAETIKYSFLITLCTAIVSAAGMTGYLKDKDVIKSRTGFNFLEAIFKYIEITQKENGKIGNWFWATAISFALAIILGVSMIFTIPYYGVDTPPSPTSGSSELSR